MAQYSGNLINTDLAQNYNRAEHEHSNYGTRRLQFFQIEIIGYDITNEPNWENFDSIDGYRVTYRGDYIGAGVEFLESRKSIVYPVLRGVAQIGEIMYNGEFETGRGQYSGNTYVIVALSMDTVSTNGAEGFDVMRSKSLYTAISESIADFEVFDLNVYPIWHRGNKLVSTQPAKYTLTVILAGSGTGNVVSSPAGFNMSGSGAISTYEYEDGVVVTLTASAAIGSVFAGWTGAATGTGTGVIQMDHNQTVVATFTDIS
jgi:hypothetical protein